MSRLNLLEALSDNIKIDLDKCVFCGICANTCILDNLRLKLAPCRQACPMGVNAQGYVQLIKRGQEDQAREIILRDLPFPEIICRICEAPCEQNCHHRAVTGEAVSIRALKRYLFDPAQEERPLPAKSPATGRKAGVVGSGPAGLCAAYDLALAGHEVTVFEAEAERGGLLRQAIPAFRLPVEVIEKELSVLDRLGVKWRCGVRIGVDLDLESLEKEFDAVILAVGLGRNRQLGVAGEDLAGVWQGLPLLAEAKNGAEPPALPGRVVVVSGGNAAVDAAQTALRLGADQVTLVALEAENELPAFESELAQARAEGVQFLCGWGVEKINGRDGRVSGLSLKRCLSVFDGCGCFSPCYDSQDTLELEAEAVIVAISQAGNSLSPLLGQDKTVDPVTLQTARARVFLAGDCQSGPGSAVRAMASGRRAAESVRRLLAEEDLHFNRNYPGPVVVDFPIDTSRGSASGRAQTPAHSCSGAGDWQELEASFSSEQARAEAGRCYSCGAPFGMYRNCWFCLPCEVECPQDALWVDVPYLLR